MIKLNRTVSTLLLTSALLTLNGCSALSSVYGSIQKDISDIHFENKISESQFYIKEANALMFEGDYASAKLKLDEAYMLYPRQASLHEAYRNYYQFTRNRKLAKLATLRFDRMVEKSHALNLKGRYAMVQLDSPQLASDLFTLSITYHDENTATLVNIATLGYTTGDYALALSSLKMLNKLGHMSPEAALIEYLVANQLGDTDTMQVVKLIMKNSWPDSKQYKFIGSGMDTVIMPTGNS